MERVEIADGLDVEVRKRRTLQFVGLRSWEVLYRDEGHRRGTCLWVGWGRTKGSVWVVFSLKCLHLVRNWLYELSFALRLILVSLQNKMTLGLLIIQMFEEIISIWI